MLTLVYPHVVWGPPVLAPLLQQVRFKRSKKRKMQHRVMTPVRREATGFPSGPSLGSIVGNPESPYTIARNIKQHLARLTAMDPTHIRRKKDFGRLNFHRVLKLAGLTHVDSKIGDEFTTGFTQLQNEANLGLQHRFPFPHSLTYKAYWGPPTVETEPNKYEGSMVGVSVSFRIKDLLLKETEAQRLIDIVGPNRFDSSTGVVTVHVDNFPERNHNAALLGDVLQQLIKLSIDHE